MAIEDTLVARALECVGLSYGNPATRRAYLQHQYRGDLDARGEPTWAADNMGESQSGCLLHVRGDLAEDEVDGLIVWGHRELDVLRCSYALPSVLGQVEGLLEELGRRRGVLVDSGEQLGELQASDIVVIGQGGQAPKGPAEHAAWLAHWGGLAHGLLVTGVQVDEAGAVTIESVEGGKKDDRNNGRSTAIALCRRPLVRRADGRWWLGDRRVAWRLRAKDLPLCRR